MSKEGSIAPKERVNIVYKPAIGNVEESVELAMKTLILGEFKSDEDEISLAERKAINVNKDNFNNVMKEQNLSLSFNVKNKLEDNADEDSELAVKIDFNALEDFTPDQIVQQVPKLKKLIELRDALKTVRSQLGNVPEFKKKIANIIADDATRAQLLEELNLKDEG